MIITFPNNDVWLFSQNPEIISAKCSSKLHLYIQVNKAWKTTESFSFDPFYLFISKHPKKYNTFYEIELALCISNALL